MFGRLFRRQQKRQVIRAETLNRPIIEVERLSRLTVAPPLQMQSNPTGTHISLAQPRPFWVKIVGSPTGGAYPWVQQIEKPGGAWADGNMSSASGAPLAYNSIGLSAPTVPVGTIVLVRWSSSHDLRFSAASC